MGAKPGCCWTSGLGNAMPSGPQRAKTLVVGGAWAGSHGSINYSARLAPLFRREHGRGGGHSCAAHDGPSCRTSPSGPCGHGRECLPIAPRGFSTHRLGLQALEVKGGQRGGGVWPSVCVVAAEGTLRLLQQQQHLLDDGPQRPAQLARAVGFAQGRHVHEGRAASTLVQGRVVGEVTQVPAQQDAASAPRLPAPRDAPALSRGAVGVSPGPAAPPSRALPLNPSTASCDLQNQETGAGVIVQQGGPCLARGHPRFEPPEV